MFNNTTDYCFVHKSCFAVVFLAYLRSNIPVTNGHCQTNMCRFFNGLLKGRKKDRRRKERTREKETDRKRAKLKKKETKERNSNDSTK